MFYHLPKLLQRWSSHHRGFLWFISGASLASVAGSIVYALLPVLIAAGYGELRAGMLIGSFCLFEALLFDPIAGNLTDRIGSRQVLLIGFALGVLAGFIWLSLPLSNIFALLLFSFVLFVSYGFRGASETYILRTSKRDEGGLLFGIFGNVSSLAVFIGTLALPFFVIFGREVLAAWLLIIIYGLSFIILFFLPNDKSDIGSRKEPIWKSINPWPAFKNGWHFIRTNNHYPLLSIGATLFEGLFYGTIWFIFPLHMSKMGLAGGESGWHLGVYDLVTAFFAGYAGYLADKYNWRHTHSLGWFFVIIGLAALPFYGWPAWLIIVGLVIAIGNNLSYYAAAHALEAHDIDHREDGAFIGVKSIVNSLGYAIAPLLAGFLYSRYGFSVSLGVNSLICASIAFSMIWLTWRLENAERRRRWWFFSKKQ